MPAHANKTLRYVGKRDHTWGNATVVDGVTSANPLERSQIAYWLVDCETQTAACR